MFKKISFALLLMVLVPSALACKGKANASALLQLKNTEGQVLWESGLFQASAAEGELCLHTKGAVSDVVSINEKRYLLNFEKKQNTAVNVSAGQMSLPLQLSAFESLGVDKAEHDCSNMTVQLSSSPVFYTNVCLSAFAGLTLDVLVVGGQVAATGKKASGKISTDSAADFWDSLKPADAKAKARMKKF